MGGTGCNNGGAGYNSLWLFLDWKKDDCHKNFVANSLGFGNVYSNAYDWVLTRFPTRSKTINMHIAQIGQISKASLECN